MLHVCEVYEYHCLTISCSYFFQEYIKLSAVAYLSLQVICKNAYNQVIFSPSKTVYRLLYWWHDTFLVTRRLYARRLSKLFKKKDLDSGSRKLVNNLDIYVIQSHLSLFLRPWSVFPSYANAGLVFHISCPYPRCPSNLRPPVSLLSITWLTWPLLPPSLDREKTQVSSFPSDMDDPSQHSPTVRQQKMEKQRQLMKEKQKKKHAQQVQMVQANDVEGRPRSGRRSAGKEERSPLVSNSGREKGQPSSYGESETEIEG